MSARRITQVSEQNKTKQKNEMILWNTIEERASWLQEHEKKRKTCIYTFHFQSSTEHFTSLARSQHQAKPADGAQVRGSTQQICPSMPMRKRLVRHCVCGCVFSDCGSSFFCGDGLIPASFSLTHFACADIPPFASRLQQPHVVKGVRKRRPKVWHGREHCVFPHLLSTRTYLFSPDFLRVTVDRRRAHATSCSDSVI